MQQYNSKIIITNSDFSTNHVKVGTVYIGSSNTDVVFEGCTFDGNSASENGGAAYIASSNTDVLFSNCTFSSNTASFFGGAVYSYYRNDYLTFSGCRFIGNSVDKADGGAIYISEDHNNLAVVDTNTGANIKTIETSHPYPTGSDVGVIFEAEVFIPGAVSLLLVFDQLTSISPIDVLYFGKNVELGDISRTYITGSFPGVDVPADYIEVNGESLFFKLVRSGSSTSAVANVDYYGFKVTVFPIYNTSSAVEPYTSVFNGNTVAGNGGAILLFFKNLSPVILQTEFVENSAFKGGAIYVDSVNGGIIIHGCE